MATRPAAQPADVGTFLLILDQFPVGTRLTVETIRDDLEAAQIRPSSYGALFRSACERGELQHTNLSVIERKASRRGGRAGIYERTQPRVERAS